MKKHFTILTFILIISHSVYGQSPFIKNYTIADGLPTNTIFGVLQDKNDFLWFATNTGVVRFDGTNYFRYTSKDGLSYSSVVRMKEDYEGRIWCMNNDGSVNIIYKNKVLNEKTLPFLAEIKTDFYYHNFFQDTDSTIYMYNGAGEVTVIKGDRYIDYTSSEVRGSVIFDITKSAKNNLLLWEGTRIIEKSSIDEIEEVHPLDFIVTQASTSPEGITYVCDIKSNIHLYKGTSLISKNYIHVDANNVNDILFKDDLIWISTFDNGLFCYRNNKLIFHHKKDKIHNATLDRYNNIWIGTSDYGVFRINFDILKYKTFGRERFEGRGINAIAPSNEDYLWLTNGQTLYILKDGEIYNKFIALEENVLEDIIHLNNNTLLTSGLATKLNIIEDLSVDFQNQSINYKKITKTFFRVRDFVISNNQNSVYCYLNNRLLHLTLNDLMARTLSYYGWGKIRNVFLNKDKDIVVNGKFNRVIRNGKIEVDSVYNQFDGKWISSSVTIDSVCEILQIEDRENPKLVLIRNNESYPLLDDISEQIDLKVEDMFYYKTTLFLFTPKTVYFISNPCDIVAGENAKVNRLNTEFNNIKDIYCQHDLLYIASDDGLTMIPVNDCVNAESTPARPYFTKVLIDGSEADLNTNEIKYKNKDRLNIEFSSINFSSSPTKYAYQLEGVNSNWINGDDRQVVYLNLKPGNYTFKLKSRKNLEPYSEVIELPITVVPTFFQLVLTKIVAVLFILLLGFLIIRNYYRQQIRVREKDNQLVTLENRALQSMMNPHFIFNSLGSIQKFLLQNKSEEAGAYLSRFARLIRQTMNSIKSNSVLLDDEIERLKNYIELEQFRMENHFNYHIHMDEQLGQDEYYIPSMIVQPFVENAIWHGISQLNDNGEVTIRFIYVDEKSLQIEIEDNGIGFKKSKAFSKSKNHLNMASTLTQKRIQLIGEKYRVETKLEHEELYPGKPNPGAKITLLVPIIE